MIYCGWKGMTLKMLLPRTMASQSFSRRFASDIHTKMGHSELTKLGWKQGWGFRHWQNLKTLPSAQGKCSDMKSDWKQRNLFRRRKNMTNNSISIYTKVAGPAPR